MTHSFDAAYNSTDYQLITLQGLAEALYVLGADHSGLNSNDDPQTRAVLALITSIKDGLNSLQPFRNAEWEAVKAAKAA